MSKEPGITPTPAKDVREWAVHVRETMRIVLADYTETTIARTGCGMFADSVNEEHASRIVEAVNSHASLVSRVTELEKALREISQLDPSDTENGFNEWGEAECFNKAQDLAKRVMEGK